MEPRTKAGKDLLALLAPAPNPEIDWSNTTVPVHASQMRNAILAIEAQAAPPDALREALKRIRPEDNIEPHGKITRKWWRLGWLSAIAVAKDAVPAALAAPATLPAIDTRIVWKRDHGMVIVTGDEEPQSLEIPAWAVRTIFDVAGKDPEEEARKVSAFINAHTGLDVERLHEPDALALDAPAAAGIDVPPEALYGLLAPDLEQKAQLEGREAGLYELRDAILPGLHKQEAEFVKRRVAWLIQKPERDERNRALLERRRSAALVADAPPDPILTYTDPAGGPDWEPRRDEA